MCGIPPSHLSCGLIHEKPFPCVKVLLLAQNNAKTVFMTPKIPINRFQTAERLLSTLSKGCHLFSCPIFEEGPHKDVHTVNIFLGTILPPDGTSVPWSTSLVP